MSSVDGVVGREPELALGLAALRRLSEGHASALEIGGEAGIGKTRLVQGLVDEARASDVAVFSGHGHPFERTRPFGVIAAALDLSPRSADPRAAAIGSMLADRGERDVHYRLIEDIVDLVETRCADGPVLLVVEDIHWADSGSVSAVSSVVRHLPHAALMVIVTHRPSPLRAEVLGLLDDLASMAAHAIRLSPLTAADMMALAGQVLGAPAGPALTRLLARAGGNPLWAVAMLRSLDREGLLNRGQHFVEATTSELPASLNELVVRRLRQLSRETLEYLQVTAVLGDAVSLRDVAAVSGRTAAEVVGGLREAFDAQLLDASEESVVFRHQLVHDAIYHQVPASARRLLHREAAGALVAVGADRIDVATHLMRGAERGDVEAVDWLRAAAREAANQAPQVALELIRGAEALLPAGHPDRDVVAAEGVQALLRAGKVTEASARAEAVLARPHAAGVDTGLRLALVGSLALQNRSDELIAVVHDSLAEPTRLQPPEQVPMLAQQSWALTLGGDPVAGETAAARALKVAERAGEPAMTVWALTALLVAVGRQGRYAEALAHARRAATSADQSLQTEALPLQPKFFLGLALFDCDLVTEARAAYREALAEEFASGWWLSDTLMADAQASFALGQWEDAVPGLVAAGLAAREKGNPLLMDQSVAYRVVIATAQGDLVAAEQLAGELDKSLAGEALSYNAGILASALAGLKQAEGDQQGAFDLLLRCWRYDEARHCRFYHRAVAPDLVRLGLTLEHHDVANEVVESVWSAAALAPEVGSVQSLALRCRALVGDELEAMQEAVDLVRRTPLLIEHAATCEDAAALLARSEKRSDASALLIEALDLYEQAGADAWAGQVRARLRALGVNRGTRGPRRRPSSGWESLTETERAVSLLVAEGLTNGAVARRLFVSPYTVNTHLRHVFAKLDVPNRVALAAVVHHSIE